ncbi:MAG: hypothetical protein PPP58_06955 [Natronomonas sp.]
MRTVALNVAANTNDPGFRGPIYDDGRFEYIPIPEVEEPRDDVTLPTYADLDLRTDTTDVDDTAVHLDPTFAGVHGCDRYTYGDDYMVKARPLLDLSAGDHVVFYATLSTVGTDPAEWIAPRWGAYVIGRFELACDPLTGEEYEALPADAQARFENNAHVRRDPFDAEVLLYGDPEGSELFDVAVPLSTPEAGVDANGIVTELSSDSGKGPWWRRPLRFDESATAQLLEVFESGPEAAGRFV